MSEQVDAHLNDLRCKLIPACLSANGLLSVSLLHRQLIAYDEVLIVSSWDSAEALKDFRESASAVHSASSACGTIRKESLIFEVLNSWSP